MSKADWLALVVGSLLIAGVGLFLWYQWFLG